MVVNRTRSCFPLLTAAISASLLHAAATPAEKPLTYPETRRVDQVDSLHGVEVADPYRWLEDLDSDETAAWVQAQNKVTFAWLNEVPARDAIRARLTRVWDYERYGIPFQEGGRYFYSKNDGLQNQSVFYVAEALTAEPRVLIDPNTLSPDGTIALAGAAISEDGRLLAYGLSAAGSDWIEYKVRDIDTGLDLPDHLKWIKFSGAAWRKDGSGFYYARYDEPPGKQLASANRDQKLFFHKLGDPQSADQLVYYDPAHPEWGYGAEVSEDGRYLLISIREGTERKDRIYYQDLPGRGEVIKLLDDFDAQYGFVGNDGPVFYFYTDQNAPRGRLIAIDTCRPARRDWREIIPESADTLQGVSFVNDQFIASYLQDAQTRVRIFDRQGGPVRDVALPGVGSAYGFGGERADQETFYSFTSFTVPGTIYRYDLTSGQSTVYREPQVDFDSARYVTKQVFYKSKDGTRIPMFLTHRRDLQLDGNNPVYLYGYGGFNAALTPGFRISRVIFLELGGIYAVANLRGGGEYGRPWHEAGRLHEKQNVFDDFIAAAEWLIANKYTNRRKLAIAGASNGGLLVGACMTQRPELFGACLPAVGVMDMLRFHLPTIGWAWKSDYGDPEKPEDFAVLRAYSPLHNIQPGVCYPPTLITTADHDDRVVPWHSFKFASALQAAQQAARDCTKPILIRIETRAGHGAGKPTQKLIEEVADETAFLVRVLELDASALRPPGAATPPGE